MSPDASGVRPSPSSGTGWMSRPETAWISANSGGLKPGGLLVFALDERGEGGDLLRQRVEPPQCGVGLLLSAAAHRERAGGQPDPADGDGAALRVQRVAGADQAALRASADPDSLERVRQIQDLPRAPADLAVLSLDGLPLGQGAAQLDLPDEDAVAEPGSPSARP